MKKIVIFIIIAVIYIIATSLYLGTEFADQSLTKVAQSDLAYLNEIGFKNRSLGFEPEFTSKEYGDLIIMLDKDAMFAYQSYGVEYGDYIVSSGFFIDSNGVQYRFEIIPGVLIDDTQDNSYLFTTKGLITDETDLLLDNQEIINICNNFIKSVEPITSHHYQTKFADQDGEQKEFDIFDKSTYKTIGTTGDYTQIECESCSDTYIKGNYSLELDDGRLTTFYYDQNNDLSVRRYDNSENVEYDVQLANEEITVGNDNIDFDYLKPGVNSQVEEYIEKVEAEYQQAKPILMES